MMRKRRWPGQGKAARSKPNMEETIPEEADVCGDADEEPGQEERRWSVGYVLSSVLLTLAVGLCVVIAAQVAVKGYVNIAGFSMFRVVTGSMEPTISVGEALICRATDFERIQPGDIICYRTEVSEIRGAIVTHRVVAVRTDETGAAFLETRGDANITSDPYPVRADQVVGRVVWYSGEGSLFTGMLSFLTGKIGFLACIVFPILLAAGLILQSSVKSLHRELMEVRKELGDMKAEPPGSRDLDTETGGQPGREEKTLPGYSVLTREDYDEILNAVRAELTGEQQHDSFKDTEQNKRDEAPG